MSREHIVFNTIFYVILTAFFIYIFVREKKIVAKIDEKRTIFENYLVNKFNLNGKTSEKILRKIIKLVESLGSALILVLIIQKFYIGNFLVPTGSMIPTIIPKDRLFGNMVIYNFKAPEREDIIVFKEPIEDKVLYTKRLMGLPGEKVQIKYDRLFVNGKKISDREYTPLGELSYNEWTVPKKGDVITIVPGQNYNEAFQRDNIDIEKVQSLLKENGAYVSQLLPDVKFLVNGIPTGMILDFIHDQDILNKLLKGETVTKTLDEDYYLALGDNTNGSYDSRMWGFVKDSRIKGKALVRFWPLNRIGLLN
ncbi:signal peptidase I [Candidatus Cetobacterium colombiensis]|uniref:Signal peptidase I n=1 Tax=Candidatus Cetobacterium colombiensis TaxID=3073100 RepID=A0ABU4W9W8_9FUSO|nr:signal peptidase I [Candidatus Cetobacterium colombiensis]MDX8336328.1 signal peptidase I [Candidatus Cetobacterium colombiensis]